MWTRSCDWLFLQLLLGTKKDRCLLSLHSLTSFFMNEKFKMAKGLAALDPGDQMIALDLLDACFHIPIQQAHRCYLQFHVGHTLSVLPFGLTSAPRVFTKLMVVVTAHLWRLGMPVSPYLDNWLLKSGMPQRVVDTLDTKKPFDITRVLHQCTESYRTPSQLVPFIRNIYRHSCLTSYCYVCSFNLIMFT